VASVSACAAVEPPDPEVIRAAQKGEPQAVEEFVTRCLPLVYNVVGRAMAGQGDVDDVVQAAMARAVEALRGVRGADPGRLRSRLVAIAVQQVRGLREGARGEHKPGDFAEAAIARLELSDQRREVAEAARGWLDDLTDQERELLALWWLEAAGTLTRADVVAAYEESGQSVESRVTRIIQRLDVARQVVRALGTTPRCEDLDVEAPWDGKPSARWRERLAHHVRGCPRCRLCTLDMVPAARLLAGLALVPPPDELVGLVRHRLTPDAIPAPAATTARATPAATGGATGGTSGGPGISGIPGIPGISRTAVIAVAAVVALTAGGMATYHYAQPTSQPERVPVAANTDSSMPSSSPHASTSPKPSESETTELDPNQGLTPPRTQGGSESPSPSPSQTPTASPTPSAPPTSDEPTRPDPTQVAIPLGTYSLRLAGESDRYLGQEDGYAAIADEDAGEDARFTVVDGLADPACHSFLNAEGKYLRHYGMRLELDYDDGSDIFRLDATFCPRAGSNEGTVALESVNYPGHYVHARSDGEVWIDQSGVAADTSFHVVAPLS
jgi:RNA polymerase sigma factor (sigma-70 family)